MSIVLKIVGGLWASFGIVWISFDMPWWISHSDGSSTARVIIGLILIMLICIFPGLILYGFGALIENKAKAAQPTPASGPWGRRA
jgi:hypothetical protein